MYEITYSVKAVLKWVETHLDPEEMWCDKDAYLQAYENDLSELMREISVINGHLSVSSILSDALHDDVLRIECVTPQCEKCKQLGKFSEIAKEAKIAGLIGRASEKPKKRGRPKK